MATSGFSGAADGNSDKLFAERCTRHDCGQCAGTSNLMSTDHKKGIGIQMLFAKKCPLCSSKMRKTDGVLTCPDCGYKESFSQSSYTGNASRQSVYYQSPPRTDSTPQTSRTYYQSGRSNPAPSPTPSFDEIVAQRKAVYGDEKKKTKKNVLIGCVLTFFILIFIPIIYLFCHSAYKPSTSVNTGHDTERAVGSYTVGEDTSSYYANLSQPQTTAVPTSEFFSQTVALIFDKADDDISRSDAEQIASLHIYKENYNYMAVDYTLTDGTSGTVYPASQEPDVSLDLTCFVNLEELYLEHSRGELNLTGLNKLHTIYFDDYISEITDTLSASQVTALGLYDVSFSLSGLSDFTNVESLYIESSMLSDIGEISELPNLKSLTIIDGDYIDDLSALYKMTQLESLYIESRTLRDVSFLTSFKNLKELTIVGSEVLDFNPLSDCTGLEKLYLLENYKASDYEFVKGMTGIKELGLKSSFNFDDSDMPDLSSLSNVSRLYLGNFESFDNLKYMTNVEELIIDDGGYGDFGSSNSLLSLPKLRSLTLTDSSVSPEMLRQISEVEGLEYLDMYSSFLWGDISPIIALPNLRELNLRYASFMLDTDSLAVNESLRVLILNNATISKANSDQWADREDIDIEKLQEALAKLHGLEVLIAEDLSLNSVAFAEGMENLKLLDITDNYVTSLAPLKSCSKLQVIACETNPISDSAGLEDILVR